MKVNWSTICREALEATNTLIKRHDCASDPEVRMVKADALYYQGSFEHALVNYFKALGHNRSKVCICNYNSEKLLL